MGLRADAMRNRAAILTAASEVFAEHGPTATTEQVAQRAGVAVGTVFRHFPTKDELLVAIMKESLGRLAALASESTLAEFFDAVVDEAVRTRMVVIALGGPGVDIGDALRGLTDSVTHLLDQAKATGAARLTVQVDEVMALLTATTYAAQQASWSAGLRQRTVAVILRGLQ